MVSVHQCCWFSVVNLSEPAKFIFVILLIYNPFWKNSTVLCNDALFVTISLGMKEQLLRLLFQVAWHNHGTNAILF